MKLKVQKHSTFKAPWNRRQSAPGDSNDRKSKPIKIYDLKTDAEEAKDLATEKPDLVAKTESLMKSARVDDPNFPMRDRKPGAAKKNAPQPAAK